MAVFVLGGAVLAVVMYALSDGPDLGWTSLDILRPGAVGLDLIVAFVARELRTAAPMVDLRLLHNRLFRSTLVVSFFGSAGFIGTLFLIPLFLQEVQGASPLESGLTTFPEAIGVVTSTQIVARLYPRVGPRRLMCAGLLGLAVAISALATFGLSSNNPWVIRVLMFFVGFCMAYVFLPNQAASLATISRAQTGRATTLTNVQRQVGGALGVAVLSSVVAAASAFVIGPSDPTPYRYALYFAAAFALIGAISALQVPDAEAAETMRPRGHRQEEPVLVEAG